MAGAGDLRERVTIQQQTVSDDTMGGEVRSWADWHTLAAEVLPTRGGASVLGEGLVGQQGYTVRVRFVRGVDITHRILWRGLVLNVLASVDKTGRRAFTWIETDSGLVTD